MKRAIGIDSIGVYVPRLFIDLTDEWARVRAPLLADGDVQKLVGKVTEGVGVRRMAVVDAHQDCATLAAMAAKRAIDAAGIDPRDIDWIGLGTETTVDQSKSTAAYVLGMLERHYGVSLADAGAPQFQFACIGATYALEAAVSRMRAGDHTKPYSLVIASDVSKYPLGTSGEYTQGAGAVALLISQDPRMVALEPGLTGTVTRDERDFFRPNWCQEAVVDGKYSIDVYLECIDAAFAAYGKQMERTHGIGSDALFDAIDFFLFHVPFPRMAEYAAARVFTSQWLASPGARAGLVAECPTAAEAPQGDSRAWRKELERAVARSPRFRAAFAQKVSASLSLGRDVGNIYSGSLYLALASLFEQSRDVSLAGRRIAFGSYGSGASAKVFSGIVSPDYAAVSERLRTHDELRVEGDGGARVALSVGDYEKLHGVADCELECDAALVQKIRDGVALEASEVAVLRAAWTKPGWRVRSRSASMRPPSNEFALERLGTSVGPQRTDVGYRYYEWISDRMTHRE